MVLYPSVAVRTVGGELFAVREEETEMPDAEIHFAKIWKSVTEMPDADCKVGLMLSSYNTLKWGKSSMYHSSIRMVSIT